MRWHEGMVALMAVERGRGASHGRVSGLVFVISTPPSIHLLAFHWLRFKAIVFLSREK